MRRILQHLRRTENETETQKAIRLGDSARDRAEWKRAASHYRAALSSQPNLPHICVQLGHSLKESGDLTGALNAYRSAISLRPDDADAHVHAAHLFKRLGSRKGAIRHLLHAFHVGLVSEAEELELRSLFARQISDSWSAFDNDLRQVLADMPERATEAPFLTKIRRAVGGADRRAIRDGDAKAAGAPMVFDVSDLIGYFRNARLPTGIQRVQLEAIEGALARSDGRELRLCCFIDGREDWLEVPVERMRAIAALATISGDTSDPTWAKAIADLHFHFSLTPPFDFPQGALLINLGTSWWLQNYFLFVRHAKAQRGIRYVPFVHDMIPIKTPEHCTRELTQDFISWAIGVFDHADHFLVNSNATKRDLLEVAATLGYTLDPANVAVIPLNADFRKDGVADLPDAALSAWDLTKGDFALFVSTVESRKGHMVAFDAWNALVERHGIAKVPQLVCVGNRGWLNDQIYARLVTEPALAAKVTMLSRLSDAELALLYRTCRFTVYPSLYEGWGLPVTESLCYGKAPLTSDAASLPEAGGDFAVYAQAGSVQALTEQAERLIFDDAFRAERERDIANRFRARTWKDLADQIAAELDHFARADSASAEDPVSAPHIAQVGAWHPMTRNRATRIAPGLRSNEAFRANLGWHWPEDRGCRVKSTGGEMRIGLAGPHPDLRLLIELLGDERERSEWRIDSPYAIDAGALEAQETAWSIVDIPAANAAHDITLRFSAGSGPDGNVCTYFVKGFFVTTADDQNARLNFLELKALNRLDRIAATRRGAATPIQRNDPAADA